MKLNSMVAKVAVAAVVVSLQAAGVAGAVVPGSISSREAVVQPAGPAMDQFRPVVREAAAGLPDHTVYRPADLKAGEDLPVLLWSNGGCRPSSMLYMTALMLTAARGFIIVADGAPETSQDGAFGTANPARVVGVMDWLDSRDAKRQFSGAHDADTIAVAGTSCGAGEAIQAGADPRVDTVMAFNGAGRVGLTSLHTPTLVLSGGPLDVAFNGVRSAFTTVTVPVARIEQEQGGHALLWYGLRSGPDNRAVPDDGRIVPTEETVSVMVNWLDATLNGNEQAKDFFDADGSLAALPGWTIDTRNGLFEPVLDVETSASSRVVAGDVRLTLLARNTDDVPVDIALSTPFGDRTFTAVKPGQRVRAMFDTDSASIEAGVATATVSATVDGELVTTTVDIPYDAHS